MSEKLSESALIKQYINICNAALLKHRQSLLLKEILALINRLYSRQTIVFKVTDDAGKPLAYFSTRFIDGSFTPVEEGDHHSDTRLRLKRRYLEQVTENAEEYIAHPAKLDWDWLTGEIKSA